MQKLECVTVSVGYGDILGVVAKYVRHLFDRWVIISTPDDRETREVCRKYSLPIRLTKEFYRGGSDFNKGHGIALGMDQLEGSGWVMHMDADIILPPDLRRWLESAHLDESCIYGFDRVMVKSWADWCRVRDSGYIQHDYHCRCNFPPGYEVGTRWVSPLHGWVPIGFAQLFHGSADTPHGFHQKPYPSWHNSASRSDVQFALQWDRRHRQIVPEVLALHLDSEPSALGTTGRVVEPHGLGRPQPSTAHQGHAPELCASCVEGASGGRASEGCGPSNSGFLFLASSSVRTD